MAQQLINVGAVANDGTGDRPRTVGVKANANFTELYSWARERVTTARTYYVSTTGSDSATGLSVSTPFLTIQKAIQVISDTLSIDDAATVTIQLANGVYTLASGVTLYPIVGGGSVVLQGDTATPGNVILTSAAAITQQFLAQTRSNYTVQGFRLQATGNTPMAFYANGGRLKIGNIEFNTGLGTHLKTGNGGYIETIAAYTILGSTANHVIAENNSVVIFGSTATASGVPIFSTFAVAQYLGLIVATTGTFSGSVQGTRYSANANAVINTNGRGANVFPGNAAGVTNNGGQYV
jgi:hypothetical protein